MKLDDASRYEILFDRAAGEYEAAQVGGIRTRTIRAGDALEVECYPLTRIGSCARVEAQRRRKQRACQEALNRRNAMRMIRRLIDQNFSTEDYVVTLTWDYGPIDRNHMSYSDALSMWDRLGLPVDEDDARRAWNNFLRRCKTAIRRAGEDPRALKHLYVLESTHERIPEDPWQMYPHYHFHAVLHLPGLTLDDIKRLWPWGDAHADRLSFRDDGPARLAAYLTKSRKVEQVDAEGRRVRRWGHSQNLEQPKVTVSDRKVSRRRAMTIAADVQQRGREILERIYPGYQCTEDPEVRYSDFVAGAYIYARLRKIPPDPPWVRAERHKGRRKP